MCIAFGGPAQEVEVIKTFVSVREPRHPAAQTRSSSAPASARFLQRTKATGKPAADWSRRCVQTPHSEPASSDSEGETSTAMVRNLPNRTKLDRLESFFRSLGFCPDSVYLPIDTRTGMNKGYAFVYFESKELARGFHEALEGRKLPGSQSSKRLSVSEATHQGKAYHGGPKTKSGISSLRKCK